MQRPTKIVTSTAETPVPTPARVWDRMPRTHHDRFFAYLLRGVALAAAFVGGEFIWFNYYLSSTTSCSFVGYNETCSSSGTLLSQLDWRGWVSAIGFQLLIVCLAGLSASAFYFARSVLRQFDIQQ